MFRMDEGSDKRPNTRKSGGASANLEESGEKMTEVGVNREEPTIEGLLEENRALKVTVKELRDQIKRMQGVELLDSATRPPNDFRLTKSEFVELSKLLREDDEEMAEVGTKELKPSRAPSTPFSIFPEEIWEQILGEVDDSKDVLNVFKAFPYLEGRVLKNKYWWLFDQVVPHLRPWLNKKVLLSCRLVCKKWAHGVENYLENQHKVVEDSSSLTGHVSYPEGSQAHIHYKLRALDKIGCEASFRDTSRLTQFLRDVEKHPSTRNPFLGRSLKVIFLWDNSLCEYHINALMNILRKFGHHIWFLNLDFPVSNFSPLVVHVISLVPNLRGIEMEFGYGCPLYEIFQDDQRALFPNLPQLESQIFTRTPSSFMDFFVTRYSAQIKSLSICQCEWMTNDGLPQFPELRNLHFRNCAFYPDDIVDMLTSFGSPDLTTLCIDMGFGQPDPDEECSSWGLTNILSLIRPFPKLQHFGLIMIGEDMSPHNVEYPFLDCGFSIKSLSISWTKAHLLASELLRWFPSLEYANIEAHDGSCKSYRPKPNDVYRWNVWKETPSLKEINFYPHPGPSIHYNRIRYEWLKKQFEESGRTLQDCIEGFESMVPVTWGCQK